jgi:hypothetical protein
LAKESRPKKGLTRKDFLRAGGIGAAGTSLLGGGALAAGCASFTKDPTRPPIEP